MHQMKGIGDVASGFVGRKSDPDEERRKPPPAYGKLLERARTATGLSRAAFAKKIDLTEPTIWRNETGHKSRSLQAMIAMRDKLIEMGQDVPAIPMGDDFQAAAISSASKLSDDAERIRWNLVRFREALGLSQAEAAHATRIAMRQWLRFEDGDAEPSGSELAQVARAFNCKTGDLVDLAETDPVPRLALSLENDLASQFNRVLRDGTDEEKAELAQLVNSIRVRQRMESDAISAAKKPKSPKRR